MRDAHPTRPTRPPATAQPRPADRARVLAATARVVADQAMRVPCLDRVAGLACTQRAPFAACDSCAGYEHARRAAEAFERWLTKETAALVAASARRRP